MEERRSSRRSHGFWRGAFLNELPFPVPFRYDIFGARLDGHAFVERPRVRAAVKQHVIPDKNSANLRLDLEIQQLEPRRSARFGVVEVDHRRPASLAAMRL